MESLNSSQDLNILRKELLKKRRHLSESQCSDAKDGVLRFISNKAAISDPHTLSLIHI